MPNLSPVTPAAARPQRPCRPRRTALRSVAALAVALGALAAPDAAAQERRGGELSARIVNRLTREAVGGARVVLAGTRVAAFTDSTGHFAMRGLPSGRPIVFEVRAIGFRMGRYELTLPTGTLVERSFELDPMTLALDTVSVAAAPSTNWRSADGFDYRRRRGIGYFITQEMIEERQANIVRDLLVVVPGVLTSCGGGRCQVQMMASGRNCTPEWFLDGFPASAAVGPDFPVQRIRSIEVYRSLFEVPPEFQRSNLRCGVVAIWSNMDR